MSLKASFRPWKIYSPIHRLEGKQHWYSGGKLPKVWSFGEQEKEKAASLTTGRSHDYLGIICETQVYVASSGSLSTVTVSGQPLANTAAFSFPRADRRWDLSLQHKDLMATA